MYLINKLYKIKYLIMSRHLSFRSGNPALNSSTFNVSAIQNETMTIKGTVDKTAMSLFLLINEKLATPPKFIITE